MSSAKQAQEQGAEPELNTIAFEKGKEVAFWLRELLHAMALEPIVKTSGKTGLHVFVPIRRTLDFDAARQVSGAARADQAAPSACPSFEYWHVAGIAGFGIGLQLQRLQLQ